MQGHRTDNEMNPKTYHVNLARVPRFAHEMILAQIARDEGIAIEDIIVEGVI